MRNRFKHAVLGLMAGVMVVGGAVARDNGLVIRDVKGSVAATVERAKLAIDKRGLKVIAHLNHAAGAAKAGLSLPPTQLLIFGNPKVGTPLMKCNRTVAIDLPQKLLIWEDSRGTHLAYNSPEYLRKRHGLDECAGVLKKVNGALAGIAAEAAE